jgi:hypothetical protein
VFKIIGQIIKIMKEANVKLMQLIEFLMNAVQDTYEDEWYMDFIEFFNALGPLAAKYLSEFPTEESKFMWFLVKYTDREEKAIDIVMEQLPLIEVMINYLQHESLPLFTVSLRLIGNISSSTITTYSETFYKNSLLEALTIGWKRIELHPDLDKEVCWLLSNMIASNSVYITKSILNNAFITNKFKEILSFEKPGQT